MIGFEIARLTLPDALERLKTLQELAVFPVDDHGALVEDDPLAQESAREMRLLLQRVLDLDARTFLNEMQRLYFHLFAADHDHFRDLLFHAAQKDPVATRDFALGMLTSDDVLFLDDQETLHDVLDVLESLGLAFVGDEDRARLRSLLAEPYFRLPSLQARLIKFLGPALHAADAMAIRRLFELDWITPQDLTWEQIRPALAAAGTPLQFLEKPAKAAQPPKISLEDFEDLRWMAGMESHFTALRMRMLGSLAAHGPMALPLFLEVSEAQPETAFRADQFETEGQRRAFMGGLEALREDVVRHAHQSTAWFTDTPEEKQWAWAPPVPPDPWPRVLRELPVLWGEFANPTDDSGFATAEIQALDELCERLIDLMKDHPLPSTERLELGHVQLQRFLKGWEALLAKILPRLDILP